MLLLFVTKQNSRDLLTAHMFKGLYLLKIATFLDNRLKKLTGLHNVILVILISIIYEIWVEWLRNSVTFI